MSRRIPSEIRRKCLDLYNDGKTTEEIYNEYYSKHSKAKLSSFERTMRGWRQKEREDEEILDTGNLSYKFKPHATTVQVNKEGEITQSWIKSKAEDTLYLELIEHIQDLPEITLETICNDIAEDYMLEIPLFDMHFGIADYDYYKPVLSQVIELIKQRTYKEINIIIGQDLFHNDDFRGRTASGREIEYTDITKAWEDARRFYYHMIKKALGNSKKVKVIYSKGNHDESMSWAFVQMLKAQFNNIEVDDEVKERKLITFGDNFIGITHGEKGQAKSKKLSSLFVMEYPKEYADAKVREVHAGHYHTESIRDDFGIMARRLSTGAITDKWHEEQGYIGNNKRFMIFEWTKEKLKSIHYV